VGNVEMTPMLEKRQLRFWKKPFGCFCTLLAIVKNTSVFFDLNGGFENDVSVGKATRLR
jgi:hypothetical protein